MSTWSLTGMDKIAGLAVTSCSRQVLVDLGCQSEGCAIVSALDDSGQALGGL